MRTRVTTAVVMRIVKGATAKNLNVFLELHRYMTLRMNDIDLTRNCSWGPKLD